MGTNSSLEMRLFRIKSSLEEDNPLPQAALWLLKSSDRAVGKLGLVVIDCFGGILLDLSRIPAQPKPGLLNVLIEIPAGSKNKYEFDKDLNAFALDRVLYSSVQYPYDYGFIPNTLADDGDPLDG
ncbi:MAG: inorganic diphosphatase, partial [Cyanobacteriota bacterium]|nr:inorganic diphosphatase [Cyanobacteriota bacterium]